MITMNVHGAGRFIRSRADLRHVEHGSFVTLDITVADRPYHDIAEVTLFLPSEDAALAVIEGTRALMGVTLPDAIRASWALEPESA